MFRDAECVCGLWHQHRLLCVCVWGHKYLCMLICIQCLCECLCGPVCMCVSLGICDGVCYAGLRVDRAGAPGLVQAVGFVGRSPP